MKTRDNKVANVATEVDASASRGIFSNELLSIMKLILVATAKNMAKINFQFRISRRMLSAFSKLPEMSERSPSKTIDSVLVMQKARSQKIPNII